MGQYKTDAFESSVLAPEQSPLPKLRELLHAALLAIRYDLLYLVIGLVLMIAVTLVMVFTNDPVFRARASIVIDPRDVDAFETQQIPSLLFADALVVDSEIEVLRSAELLNKIVLQSDWLDSTRAMMVEAGQEPPSDTQIEVESLKRFRQNLTVERDARTFIVRVSFTDSDPEVAAHMVNTLADAYIQSQGENRLKQAESAGEWLQGQIDEITSQIAAAESEAQMFRLANALPDGEALGQLDQEILNNENRLVGLRNGISQAQSDLRVVARAIAQLDAGETLNLYYLAEVLDMPAINAMGAQIEELSEGAGRADADSQRLVTALLGQTRQMLTSLAAERESAIDIAGIQVAALDQTGGELRTARTEISEKLAEFSRLQRNIGALRNEEARLLERFYQTQRSERYYVGSARVIEWARTPQAPANQPGKTVFLAGIFGGLLIGLGLVFARAQINDGARKSNDVTERLGYGFIGTLPHLSAQMVSGQKSFFGTQAQTLKRQVRQELGNFTFAMHARQSRYAQVIRRVLFEATSRSSGGLISLGVVSCLTNEGRSTTAANIASLSAESGRKTLLVVHDQESLARWEQVGEWVSLVPQKTEGRTEEWHILRVSEQLYVLNMYSITETAEAWTLSNLKRMIAAVGIDIGFIVVDIPALAYRSDASKFAPLITGALLVVAWGRTPLDTAKRVMTSHSAFADRIMGVALSDAPERWIDRFEGIPAQKRFWRRAI